MRITLSKAYNSHGCVPAGGSGCHCPRVYRTCTAWDNLQRQAAAGVPEAVADLAIAEAELERIRREFAARHPRLV